MLKLAQSLKLNAFNRSSGNRLTDIQALLLGCSGLLFDLRIKDNYVSEIKAIWSGRKDYHTVGKTHRGGMEIFQNEAAKFPDNKDRLWITADK